MHGLGWVHPMVVRLATSPGQCQLPVDTNKEKVVKFKKVECNAIIELSG